MSIEELVGDARAHIEAHEHYGLEHARAAGEEIRLEAERSALKTRLAKELLGTPNPATGRAHSAESAKDAAAVSDEYLAHVKHLSETVDAKNAALTRKDSAFLRSRLAIAVLESEKETV